MSNVFCTRCGAPVAPGKSLCASCKSRIETTQHPRRRLSKKAVIGIVAAAAVVVAGVMLLIILLGGNDENSRGLRIFFIIMIVPVVLSVLILIILRLTRKNKDWRLVSRAYTKRMNPFDNKSQAEDKRNR